jgi:phosphate-selective porin OprO/OprP
VSFPFHLRSRDVPASRRRAAAIIAAAALGIVALASLAAAHQPPSSLWQPPMHAAQGTPAVGKNAADFHLFAPPNDVPIKGASAPQARLIGASSVDLPALAPESNLAPSEPVSIEQRLADMEQEIERLNAAADKAASKAAEKPSAHFTMQLQADAYTFDQDPASFATVGDIPDGTAFRRARVGWFGDWQQTEYRIEFDFALAGRPSFLDVWAGLKDVPVVNYVRVGHFFEPFSLERITSNRFTTFMERNLGDSAFAPARNMGIAAFNHSESERMTWAIGIFADRSNDVGDDVGEDRGEAVTGRLTWLPFWADSGRHYVHLGIANSLRNPSDDEVRYASRPEARLGAATPNVPDFVDTGFIPADGENRSGLEAAWINGPFSVISEYMCAAVDQIDGPNLFFYGGYIQTSYFLTGEHRPYKRTMPNGGCFERVIPHHNFWWASRNGPHGCGWGAWEIAGRISHLDGTDENILGRELTDLTLGLNWYMTPHLRFTSNYVHAFLDDSIIGRSDTGIYAMRIGYEF